MRPNIWTLQHYPSWTYSIPKTCTEPRENLVVALIGDESKKRYPFNQKERAEAVSLLGIANSVLLLEDDDLERAIKVLRPTILVLGNEYKDNPEIESTLSELKNQGGSVQFHAGETHYANAELLSDLRENYVKREKHYFRMLAEDKL